MSKNYYEILLLKRDSTNQEIAQSYQKMVLRWHPKFAKQDQKTAYYHFSEISQAYEVLSDPIKRSFYDKYGYQKLKEGLFAQGQLKGGYRFANNPDQIYEKFFNSNNAFAKVFDKAIVEQGSLFSNAFGGLKYKDQIQYLDLIVDINCASKLIKFKRNVLNLDGRTTSLIEAQKLIEIKPGYSNDTVIQFSKEGHQSVHRVKSNLLFQIKTINHNNFERIGNDLVYTAKITLIQALNCKIVQLITLDNRKLRVSIDEIVSPSTLKQVLNEGMPILGSQKKGNLYIKFDIVFPTKLTEEKKKLLRKLLP